MSGEIRKVFLTGLGAFIISRKKTREIINTLMAKGELTVEQYKAMNQEIKRTAKRNMTDKDKDNSDKPTFSQILDGINSLTPDELTTLESKLTDLRKAQ